VPPFAALVLYVLLTVAFTWPLSRDAHLRIASDPGDPILNTSILVWNATTVPFSARWWDAPHYYPTQGVTTLTENLLGMYPVASPIYWLTENPVLTYNLTLFVTWPLSAFGVFLLVRLLTGRGDAAFLAGLAFGFSPYRAVAFGHLQTLATFGVPFALLGAHGYLRHRRWPWLALFGAAWLQQGLANGYYILYGGLFLGLWTVYFCSPRAMWPRASALAGAAAVASLPLVPILVTYQRVHEELGLRRSIHEIQYFSATPRSWFEVWSDVQLWSEILPQGKDNMFPGLTVVVLAAAGAALPLVSRKTAATTASRWHPLHVLLAAAVAVSVAAILVVVRYGPVDTMVGPVPVKIRDLHRAFAALLLAGVPLLLLRPRTREALRSRSAFAFYLTSTVLFGLLACGPELRVGETAVMDPAPYGWLMALPGFNELRVPTQLKMIHLLCLTVAAGLAYAAFRPGGRRAAVIFGGVALGIMADGWTKTQPMEPAPARWEAAEPGDRNEPILELPMAHGWGDFAATLRGAIHHRRVLNGVSGYDPPHYAALRDGLAARDPALLTAIASLGAFDIVVDGAADPDGALMRYAASAPGAAKAHDDGIRTVFRIPAAAAPPPLGESWPIARVQAVRNDQDAHLMHDGRFDTGWGDNPQRPDEWVLVDLGQTRRVAGVTHTTGGANLALHYPRRLAIEISQDGAAWERVWEGSAFAHTFLAFVREPRRAELQFVFESRAARFVRLRQLEAFERMWWISELRVHAPPGVAADTR
jgi:hypothetical protein